MLGWTTQYKRFAELNMVQDYPHATTFAPHLILPKRTQSPTPQQQENEQKQPLEYEKNNTFIILTFYLLDKF